MEEEVEARNVLRPWELSQSWKLSLLSSGRRSTLSIHVVCMCTTARFQLNTVVSSTYVRGFHMAFVEEVLLRHGGSVVAYFRQREGHVQISLLFMEAMADFARTLAQKRGRQIQLGRLSRRPIREQ